MPDDIIDVAQKTINDAANKAGVSSSDTKNQNPPPAPPVPVVTNLPPEPEPLPLVDNTTPPTSSPPSPQPLPEPTPLTVASEKSSPIPETLPVEPVPPEATPPPSTPPPPENISTLVEDLLETQNPAPVVAPLLQPKKPHKKSSKGVILGVLALLLLILPVSVYFISQQNQQIADTRSKASGLDVYNLNDPLVIACRSGNDQACRDLCGESPGSNYTCAPPGTGCGTAGGIACTDWHWTVCIGGGTNGVGCGTGDDGDDDNGDDDNPPPPTATPTQGTTPVCQHIKIYKDGVQVTDLPSLRPEDDVVLAVQGNLSPAKARFRVNGGAWTETTTTNVSGEFTLAYTIPLHVTDFVIEGEVFTNGAWR